MYLTHLVLLRAPQVHLASGPPFHYYRDFLIIFAPLQLLPQCPEVSCCWHAGFNLTSLLKLSSVSCSRFKCHGPSHLSKSPSLQSVILKWALLEPFCILLWFYNLKCLRVMYLAIIGSSENPSGDLHGISHFQFLLSECAPPIYSPTASSPVFSILKAHWAPAWSKT